MFDSFVSAENWGVAALLSQSNMVLSGEVVRSGAKGALGSNPSPERKVFEDRFEELRFRTETLKSISSNPLIFQKKKLKSRRLQ